MVELSKQKRTKWLRTTLVSSLAISSIIFVSGCAVNNSGLTPELVATDKIVTNSVVKPSEVEGVEISDAETIKSQVVAAKGASPAKPLAWTNPETGSSGTIVAIDKFMGKHGQKCRGFKTSVDTFMGISFYNGEACEISPHQWVLSWFKPAA